MQALKPVEQIQSHRYEYCVFVNASDFVAAVADVYCCSAADIRLEWNNWDMRPDSMESSLNKVWIKMPTAKQADAEFLAFSDDLCWDAETQKVTREELNRIDRALGLFSGSLSKRVGQELLLTHIFCRPSDLDASSGMPVGKVCLSYWRE